VKFSCIHGGRNYKATGKVRKTSYVLFLSEKKSRHPRPTFYVTSVLQHDTVFLFKVLQFVAWGCGMFSRKITVQTSGILRVA